MIENRTILRGCSVLSAHFSLLAAATLYSMHCLSTVRPKKFFVSVRDSRHINCPFTNKLLRMMNDDTLRFQLQSPELNGCINSIADKHANTSHLSFSDDKHGAHFSDSMWPYGYSQLTWTATFSAVAVGKGKIASISMCHNFLAAQMPCRF